MTIYNSFRQNINFAQNANAFNFRVKWRGKDAENEPEVHNYYIYDNYARPSPYETCKMAHGRCAILGLAASN